VVGSNSNLKVAVKVIDIKAAATNNVSLEEIQGEVDVLKGIDSP